MTNQKRIDDMQDKVNQVMVDKIEAVFTEKLNTLMAFMKKDKEDRKNKDLEIATVQEVQSKRIKELEEKLDKMKLLVIMVENPVKTATGLISLILFLLEPTRTGIKDHIVNIFKTFMLLV